MENGGSRIMFYAALIAGLAGLDLAFKYLIEKQEPGEFPRPLRHTKERIWLYRNHNSGFPFGFLKEYGQVVRTVPLIIISGLGGILCYLLPKKGAAAEKWGISLILGGALSNLYDRYVRRFVVDYVNVRAGALKQVVFNLGDLFVFAGTLFLALLSLARDLRSQWASMRQFIKKAGKIR